MTRLDALRDEIVSAKCRPEEECVAVLKARYATAPDARRSVEEKAASIVAATRERRDQQPLLDAFLQIYGLSNQEGVALMCLAEALLRAPDAKTRDDLIADKIGPGDWLIHSGKSDSLFVNASTWGLMLTGKVVALDEAFHGKDGKWLAGLTNKLGEPVIRAAMLQAMRILGAEFVLGETIEQALKRGARDYSNAQIFSFDMLGEGARTFADADKYFEAYAHAIRVVGARDQGKAIEERSGVSVKLSALHPRYEPKAKDVVLRDLGGCLIGLAELAASCDVKLSIDAEEADRLDLSLDLFEFLARSPSLANWRGLGLVVQAYGKRAPAVIAWLDALAEETGRRFMVRLVKGAYWDAEIKHAQEQGLADFPVFTNKVATDLSYLVCANDLLAKRPRLYCQFATHNAHTIAAVLELAKGDYSSMEFQRLHGMGELVYEDARRLNSNFPLLRVYAPVGGHRDLLAYLVRRLLENGANSSFVNRFMDASVPAREIVRDPASELEEAKQLRHPAIALPENLFGTDRKNAKGLDLAAAPDLETVADAINLVSEERFEVRPLIPHASRYGGSGELIRNPADRDDRLGTFYSATPDDIDLAFNCASCAQPAWNRSSGEARSEILLRAADLLEASMPRFMALLTREAGKTWEDALAEVREAVDFCRYYGRQAAREFAAPQSLPGPTGESNDLRLHGRGVFVCISPWNFPLAIFLGQVTAALAAGNAVIAKPAEQTPIVAHEAVKLLHLAGVPENVLCMTPGDGAVGAALVEHEGVAGVAFTGGTDTAQRINRALAAKDGPIVPLIAETGGQNVMFVDSTALLEQVSDDVVQSAFKSAGQRCSALRVLYLQEEIADRAIEMICGAMDALTIGDPQLMETDVGPAIDRAAAESLNTHIAALRRRARATHSVDLPPECSNGTFVAPHLFEIGSIRELAKEQFGPVLHIVRYKSSSLADTLQEAFSTGYGLTLGVHTRMDVRWREIFERAPVGNTYVNRNMVGAVVGSQPFGGCGLSGTGFKAGGPRYLYRFAMEKALTVNTMASGGNAELLSL